MDSYHLFFRYRAIWGNLDKPIPVMKNSELARAESILRHLADRKGKGYLLLNLRPDPYDQTLTIAADGYCDGPWKSTEKDQANWTAALVNRHYRPFLSGRFPRSEWHDLGTRLAWPCGYLALAVFPDGSIDPETLGHWIEADRALQSLTSFLLNRRLHETDRDALERLAVLYPPFKGDPFLESCFFEKAYLYFIRSGDNQGAERSLQSALSRGYPAAHFFYQMGHLMRAQGREKDARRFFRRAVQAPDNRTDAARYLDTP